MNKTYIIFFSFIFAFAMFSCSKYEDGPLISLKSKKNRLLGVWKVVEFKKDNEDLTQFYQDTCGCDVEFTYEQFDLGWAETEKFNLKCDFNNWNFQDFEEDDNYDRFLFTKSKWAFSKDKSRIWLELGYDNDSRYRWGMYPLTICKFCWEPLEILRLTSDDLWVRYEDFYNVYTIKFEKK